MAEQTYTLVSCIMPTANREKFVPHAIHCFLQQDYPNTELIIVDDGINAVEHLVPIHPKIKYTRIPEKFATLGEKRNYACSICMGDIIMHWDDDDWYAPQWISKQVQTLFETGADICGLCDLLFYAPALNQCWKYVYPPAKLHWVAGATLAYTRAFWLTHPFRPKNIGEDNDFVWQKDARVAAHNFTEGFISTIHGHNTSPKHVHNKRFMPYSVDNIRMLLKAAGGYYDDV